MLPVADIFSAYTASDAFGKGIVLIQLVASVGAMAYAIGHWLNLKRDEMLTRGFRRYFAKTRSVVDYYFTHTKGRNPIVAIYFPATERLLGEIAAQTGGMPQRASEAAGRQVPQSAFDLVKGVAEEALAVQNHRAENGMNYLGAVTTLAPFLGLLGTVLGVMGAFQDMGGQGAVNLGTVAPYLSTAMLTTVVGLVVAIPSIIGYNVLARKIGELQIQFDGFTDEYLGRVRSEFCVGAAAGGAPRAAEP
ncbi:MAG: MotA/TolQ/ExbB proton channel family protein [Kiritimatiellae bacterium]|nr:MotA/TolQ/ExbB proton channel family protein [Kiritimatiellia bacterium]